MKKLKLYIETSVWNFLFVDDAPEKKEVTEALSNSINKKMGYREIDICRPEEVSEIGE